LIQVVHSLFILYCWTVAAILISFLFLIGRFYEIKLRKKSYYQLFLLPLLLFLAAASWYALFARDSTGTRLYDFVGVLGPDFLSAIGGLVLIALGFYLHHAMMGGRR